MSAPTRESRALAETIRELRRAREITQENLALDAGLGISYVAQLERSAHNASFTAVARLAAAMGVPMREVVDRYEARLAAGHRDSPSARR